ncbi:hypothetical protein SYNPS1DRAFT_21736 [Syncephalis pseudoplumigaleata]|uniref:Smr domain-containing protein n=1 Tax=Syncephalis pseudoplumigaleata TaxID=1712513 RepID=A0A4P9Z4M1_9FUNG|nr:hypothetical protein SYNPS1DRAFT_21736 [Syncephalis pseudoplumigaleata]|eukprot:RKP26520.1 hypothetical protein SYNPS1DRAFT_21736 [Syncephalis pseudoplumigaleata]
MSPTKKNGCRQSQTGRPASTNSANSPPATLPASTARAATKAAASNGGDNEAFLQACFPGLPTAHLKSAVGRCNGDMERIMDWLLGEMHENKGELQYSLQLGSTTSAASSSGPPSLATHSAGASDRGQSTDAPLSGSASTITVTSGSSSSGAVQSGSGSTKSATRVMHIDEFLARHPTTVSAYAETATATATAQNRNCWSEIERLTHHLAVIFPQISRDVIRSTLLTCALDVEETVARLANPPAPTAEKSPPVASSSRGLSRWRPDGKANAHSKKKASPTTPKPEPEPEPEDESLRLDAALCQLTTVLPDHDVDVLVAGLIHCNLKVDATINYILSTASTQNSRAKASTGKKPSKTRNNSDHGPAPLPSPRAQKIAQQQQDFWTAHRYQRETSQPGRDYDQSMRRWNTRAAIGVLRSFQKHWAEDYVVDLHYMTVEQALEVALLAVQDWATIEQKVMATTGKSKPRPLRIVTGAGSHSQDGRAKLFPRIQRALREAGWPVAVIDRGSFMVSQFRAQHRSD